MCARFTQHYTWAQLRDALDVFGTLRNLRARYNIAPTDDVDVIWLQDGNRELVTMRWGLVPFFWSKRLKEVPATFNARAETVSDKPMFRDAFKRRRCLIPASGFYEWTGEKGDKQPHLFTAADGSPLLAFAGLWDRWHDPEAAADLLTCTVIVSGASDWMTPYHDRMPVLLDAGQCQAWLDGTLGQGDLKPAPEAALRQWLVSRRMNKAGVGDDDPATVAPTAA